MFVPIKDVKPWTRHVDYSLFLQWLWTLSGIDSNVLLVKLLQYLLMSCLLLSLSVIFSCSLETVVSISVICMPRHVTLLRMIFAVYWPTSRTRTPTAFTAGQSASRGRQWNSLLMQTVYQSAFVWWNYDWAHYQISNVPTGKVFSTFTARISLCALNVVAFHF